VLPGGRLSWYEPASNRWWQRNHFGGAARDTDLGFIERRSGRGFSVNHPRAPKHLHATKMTLEAFESRMGVQRQRALHASQSQAHLLRVHLGNPGGVGELAIDANASTLGLGAGPRPGLSDRPQVLAALIKASVGAANGADASSVRRRALAEALASNEERAVVGAPPVRAAGERTQVSAVAVAPDPTGFEAIEDTVAAAEAKVAPPEPVAPPVAAPPNDVRRTTGGSVAAEQKRLEMERRAQTARSAQAWAAQRPKDGRRTTIPPPMPRTMPGPPPLNPRSMGNAGRTTGSPTKLSVGAGRTTGKGVAASIAPTAMHVGCTPPRPVSSLRDRLLLVAAVGAASLAVVALYGSTGAPTNAPAAASAASAAPGPAPSATPSPVASAAPAPAEVRSAELPTAAKPAVDAVPPASAGAAARPAPRAARGPRPKVATGGTAKGDPNPYDPPAVEPIERLVEERR
jgi:hypothetical protein